MEYLLNVAKEISPGIVITLGLFFATIVLSIPLGFLLSLGAVSKIKPLKGVIKVYNWLLRGTPLMLQIVFIYFVIPLILLNINKHFGTSYTFNLAAFPATVLAFVLNYAAYFCEIFRAGILSIDKGQYEGSKALGFTSKQTTLFVILPQMVRRVLPPVANETINLVKDTSLGSIIALTDILYLTKIIVMRTGNILPFLVTAIFYLVFTFVLTVIFNKLEKRFNYTKLEN